MPARSQSRNLWPFSSKKRVVLSKEELKRIGDTQRRAMEADLQRQRGGSSASLHRGSSAPSRTAARPSSVSYKGYTIKPTEDGEAFVIPKLDPDSHFDTLKDAKAFLTSWKKNPNEAKKLVKTTQKGGRSVLKFYDTLQTQVGRITDIPRKIAGKLVGENPSKYQEVAERYMQKVQAKYGDKVTFAIAKPKRAPGGTYLGYVEWYDNGHLKVAVPNPTTPAKLNTLIHECCHALAGHGFHDDPQSKAEYEASACAHDALSKERVGHDRREEEYDISNVIGGIESDIRHNRNIDPRAVRMVKEYFHRNDFAPNPKSTFWAALRKYEKEHGRALL
jgi:hypothetical protein